MRQEINKDFIKINKDLRWCSHAYHLALKEQEDEKRFGKSSYPDSDGPDEWTLAEIEEQNMDEYGRIKANNLLETYFRDLSAVTPELHKRVIKAFRKYHRGFPSGPRGIYVPMPKLPKKKIVPKPQVPVADEQNDVVIEFEDLPIAKSEGYEPEEIILETRPILRSERLRYLPCGVLDWNIYRW
jgi:hypothetical protein